MLEILDATPDDVVRLISEGVARANAALDVSRENFSVVERIHGQLVGGVTASVSFSVLFINNLWVSEDRRRAGLGRALMQAAEGEGKRRGAMIACVDTLSVQAPEFYAGLNYKEFGRLSGELNGRPLDRLWFSKPL